VSLDSLSVQQLTQVKKQLDEEVEHLSASFTQLVAAQRKFQECLRCVQKQGLATKGRRFLAACSCLGSTRNQSIFRADGDS
jgi:prefoldin subunit 5